VRFLSIWTPVIYDIAVATVRFKNVSKARRFSLLYSKAKLLRENRIHFENDSRILLGWLNQEELYRRGTWHVWGEERCITCRVLVDEPEKKRPLGKHRRRWVDNIKMDLHEVWRRHELDLPWSQYWQVAGCCQCGNELWVPNWGEYFCMSQEMLISHEGLCSMELVR